jgi:hypothetical protein
MQTIERHIKGLMLVSGTLTMTMLYAAVAPAAALQSTFGESLQGPLAEVVVRNWGVLIGLMGGLLIHGAFNPAVRRTALLTAGASKVAFIALVLANGTRYLGDGAGTAVVVDAVTVLLFGGYLLAAPEPHTARLAAAAGAVRS